MLAHASSLELTTAIKGLADVTSEQTARLQKIQNHAARLTFCKKRLVYVTPLLKKLHWLPVSERVVFKLATLSFGYFDGTLPPYLFY